MNAQIARLSLPCRARPLQFLRSSDPSLKANESPNWVPCYDHMERKILRIEDPFGASSVSVQEGQDETYAYMPIREMQNVQDC